MLFDVHTHLFPKEYLRTLERFGKKLHRTELPADGSGRERPRGGTETSDLNFRIDTMDAAGVDVHVLSPAGQLPYFIQAADAALAARQGNDLFAEFVARKPDRLAFFAVTPLPHVDEALSELTRAMDELGAVGAIIGTSILGKSITEPALNPFYEELNRRRAVLYVHPSGVAAECPLIANYNMTWSIGAHIEDTIAAFHLLAADIPSRYPNIKIVISHVGGALPVMLGRLEYLYATEVPAAESPNQAARRMWYDTVCHDDVNTIKAACNAFGVDRLIYSSDYPYVRSEGYTKSVQYLHDVGLPEKDVHAILNRGDELFPDIARTRHGMAKRSS